MAKQWNPDPRTDQHTPSEALVRMGMMVLHSIHAVWRVLWFLLYGILRMLWYMLRQAGRFFGFLWQNVRHAFKEHNRPAQEMLRDVKRARKAGTGQFLWQAAKFAGSYIFGEHGIVRTGFNYVLPVVSILFLIGIVNYGSSLDYALSVSVNGEEIGIIASEQDFEDARDEVRQRIEMAGEEMDSSFTPLYNLRIVSEDDKYISAHAIADKLLAGSHVDLEDAYGVYVDGEFIGAVRDKDKVSSRMAEELAKYAGNLGNMVNEVYYGKEVTYQEGVYLAATLSEPTEIIRTLTAETQQESAYTVREGDSPQLIAAMFDMTDAALLRLNPDMEDEFETGMTLRVTTTSRYIPIVYTKNMTVTSYIDYGSVRVETAALNLGEEEVISRGVIGERTSDVCVTYIDGVENSRQVLNTVVTKEPIPEQIGVGTYSPAPASTTTVLSGTGKYGWPVNGGYISDPFGSDRNHKGLDIAASMGTEIYAAEGGTVYRAGWNSGGYGNYVIIDHPDGYR
ncbi:MAG: M23 family metallopeptidase, partial [Oscillospiraceae bacterium]|nr:M23 family metallopeptidase [Oscillospiraceae bacterium]